MFKIVSENLALILSFIAISLSILNFVYLLISRQKNISIQIIESSKYVLSDKVEYQFDVLIENYSHLPISISKIKINNEFISEISPQRIYEHTRKIGGEVIEREIIKSFKFPISLAYLGGDTGYLVFRTKEEIDISSLKLTIYTSRGIIKNLTPTFFEKYKHSNHG